MYHGCTLGGTSLEDTKRHPTIGDHVVIGAGSTILGPVEIGTNSKIGANSVVLESHASNSTIVGIPARSVRHPGSEEVMRLEHGDLPDLLVADIEQLSSGYQDLRRRQEVLENAIEQASNEGKVALENLDN
jgi:serine O-acetyltransferase